MQTARCSFKSPSLLSHDSGLSIVQSYIIFISFNKIVIYGLKEVTKSRRKALPVNLFEDKA